jgi:Mg2+-importing ATPase
MKITYARRLYQALLQPHRFVRHFRRLLLLESVVSVGSVREFPKELTRSLIQAANSDADALLERFHSHRDGLTEAEAESLREVFGVNKIEQDKPLSARQHLWLSYRNPFNLLLTVLALISFLTGDLAGTLVIITMVVLSTLLRFWQESRANKEADALKAMVSSTTTVLRRVPQDDSQALSSQALSSQALSSQALQVDDINRVQQLNASISQLVPGDVVVLSAGDMIPADCRLLVAKDLFVAQVAMTGESMPVEKYAAQRDSHVANPLELNNILFMGTTVISGAAMALVVATGKGTYLGTLAKRISQVESGPTSFQEGVNRISWLLIRFMLVMAPLVLFINVATKHNWMQALLFALSVAVGLIPEMLPMVVTSTLAKGAVFLSRKKVIVKRLDAIQNFGAMDVLCTDKTGTLTQDKIFLARHVDVWGEESDDVLRMAYLNSYYQTGLKNLLDVAVLEHAEVHRELEPARNYHKVDEIPFDFSRRRMSVVVAEHDESHLLICKGAVDEMLSVCSHVRHGEQVEELRDELLKRIRQVTSDLNEEGLRVVAVAVRELPPVRRDYGLSDEQKLVLAGYVAFLDPPKESTAPALEELGKHGVKIKVLTGDNAQVTQKICHEVGLKDTAILTGELVENMEDAALCRAVETHGIFAKLTPLHKERIVRCLKANHHVVGFIGDGINDAPALRAADIGISVDSGVDIAKEAADIILLEKSLLVLSDGVLEGRRTFSNMLKYIKMTASSNFGNVFSVLIASLFLPFLPMLPVQLLLQNMLYDISQIAIPFDHVDKELLAQPQRWQPAEVGRFMLFFGSLSSVFDILTFLVMWNVFHANSPARQSLFQSGWFVVGLLTQTLIVHMIRTAKVPFLQSRAATPLVVMTLFIMAVGIFLPMGPLASDLKMQALPVGYFLFLPLVLLGYAGLVQVVKGFYQRRWGWQ